MLVEKKTESQIEVSEPQVASILDRRKQLKRQRRVRFWQTVWRTGAILGLTVTLGWGLNQPEWKVRSLEQVTILGHSQVSTETLQALLPITYPSSLIQIQPQAIAQQLTTKAHIETVTVSRQLFPPQVSIVVQERLPVAKTTCNQCVLSTLNTQQFKPSNTWLIDATGVPLPLSSYPALSRTQSLPELSLKGFLKRPQTSTQANNIVDIDKSLKKQWQAAFPQLHQSPLKIREVDWQDPNNLKITTELGLIHLGKFSNKLKLQLQVLDKMRSLASDIDIKTLNYIDVSDPEHPILELKPSSAKSKNPASVSQFMQ